MVKMVPSWRIHVAGLVALAGYSWLAIRAGEPEARPALALATVGGWLALAAVAWRHFDSTVARWSVVVWAVTFRLAGIGTTPTWEDDYYRYLWDGYQLLESGNPYKSAPLDFFGEEDQLPREIVGALDFVNHPERVTVYGPMAQFVFGVCAWLNLGSLAVLKLVLVGLEIVGWWALRSVLGWRGWVLVWWCPLAVTEVAFAGHAEAIGVAAMAVALAGWKSKKGARASTWSVVVAGATKPFGWVLVPFVVDRWGVRSGWRMVGFAVVVYLPFLFQGSMAEWGGLWTMGQRFEYNSTGYALLTLVLSEESARMVGAGLTLVFAGLAWQNWRQGNRELWPPVAAILAVAFWWSPVFNPWYALWILPSVALRPSGWGIGVLIAVPLAYTHGWGQSGGAVVSYLHPWWTRPLEVLVVLLAATSWWGWRNWRGQRVC